MKAIVAMDNLAAPTAGLPARPTPESRPANPVLSKPALGLTNDYALFEQAKTSCPTRRPSRWGPASSPPRRRHGLGRRPRRHALRGCLHPERGLSRDPARQRSVRLVPAGMVRQVRQGRRIRGRTAADRPLAPRRLEAAADLTGDGNQFSQYYLSRMSITRGTQKATCENLRDGCAGIVPDGLPEPYSFLKEATTKDAPGTVAGVPASQAAGGSTAGPPAGQAAGSGDPACRDRTAPVTRLTRSRTASPARA